jgi:hypothetical protein
MSKKLLVILLVFGLVVGNLTLAPVAKGVTNQWTTTMNIVTDTSLRFQFAIYCYGTFPTSWVWDSITLAGPSGVVYYDSGASAPYETYKWNTSNGANAATGTYTVTYHATSNLGVASGTVSYVYTGGDQSFGTGPVYDWESLPLEVTLSGLGYCAVGTPYTCTATATGGTSPYQYLFQIQWVTVIGGVNNYTTVYTGTLQSSGSFTYTFSFIGDFLIKVTAIDSGGGGEAYDTLELNASVNKPVLWAQIYDIPDGNAAMTYLNFKLFPDSVSKANPPVANGAIETQYYTITSPGTVEQGSVYYMLTPVLITALPNPLLIYVNYHDPNSKEDWSYVFSFDTTNWGANSWALSNGDTGTGSGTPGAFAWLWDLLVRLFKVLFVPSSSDFTANLASGWITIASPVPTITPQYTIPFPNPVDISGEASEISFANIQTWTYYSTVKTIMQVFLDGILVFIVIGLVT